MACCSKVAWFVACVLQGNDYNCGKGGDCSTGDGEDYDDFLTPKQKFLTPKQKHAWKWLATK